ncbi:Uncharacterised protein [Mycobacteroides abscessus subsp. abscessus]|nr:Uncharacterised protein [Mycobacteroides abscessus subsp. abscessus]
MACDIRLNIFRAYVTPPLRSPSLARSGSRNLTFRRYAARLEMTTVASTHWLSISDGEGFE